MLLRNTEEWRWVVDSGGTIHLKWKDRSSPVKHLPSQVASPAAKQRHLVPQTRGAPLDKNIQVQQCFCLVILAFPTWFYVNVAIFFLPAIHSDMHPRYQVWWGGHGSQLVTWSSTRGSLADYQRVLLKLRVFSRHPVIRHQMKGSKIGKRTVNQA